MIIFLDFDGVLHPEHVFMTKKGPMLAAGGELFMWAGILESVLEPLPEVQLVLSTSWVRQIGFARATKRLPNGLQRRVIGATWHSSTGKNWADQDWWANATRYSQIMKYLARSGVTDWLALDDDVEGWAATNRHHLIQTTSLLGISDERVVTELKEKLHLIDPRSVDGAH